MVWNCSVLLVGHFWQLKQDSSYRNLKRLGEMRVTAIVPEGWRASKFYPIYLYCSPSLWHVGRGQSCKYIDTLMDLFSKESILFYASSFKCIWFRNLFAKILLVFLHFFISFNMETLNQVPGSLQMLGSCGEVLQ